MHYLKYFLFVLNLTAAILVTPQALADQIDNEGILRDDGGAIYRMDHSKAMKACPAGTHLATAREQAQRAQTLGAHGILELSEVIDGVPPGYAQISAINPDGTLDKFYYNSKGYKQPADCYNCAFRVVWSSSVSSMEPRTNGYFFHDAGGNIPESGLYSNWAVRCVPDPISSVPPSKPDCLDTKRYYWAQEFHLNKEVIETREIERLGVIKPGQISCTGYHDNATVNKTKNEVLVAWGVFVTSDTRKYILFQIDTKTCSVVYFRTIEDCWKIDSYNYRCELPEPTGQDSQRNGTCPKDPKKASSF